MKVTKGSQRYARGKCSEKHLLAFASGYSSWCHFLPGSSSTYGGNSSLYETASARLTQLSFSPAPAGTSTFSTAKSALPSVSTKKAGLPFSSLLENSAPG